MNMNIKTFHLTTLLLCFGFNLNLKAQQTPPVKQGSTISYPKATNYTNDLENILTPEEEIKLNELIRNIDNETLLEFAVVTIPSKNLATVSIDNYSLELAKRWGVGKKELNNGILIALSREKRVIRIQIGFGIETIYTNEQTGRLIKETFGPSFSRGGYYEGLYAGIVRMTEELRPNLKKLVPKNGMAK